MKPDHKKNCNKINGTYKAKGVPWLPPRMDPLWDPSAGVFFRWDEIIGCHSIRVGVGPSVLTSAWRLDAIERKTRSVPRAWREIDWSSYF